MTPVHFSQLAQRLRVGLATAFLAALLSACGGGQDETPSSSMPPTAQARLNDADCDPQAVAEGTAQARQEGCVRASAALREHARPQALAAAAAVLTPDMLMDWAERQYPHLFAPASRPTQISPPYSYRHYPDTGNYLGVAGNDVYVLGPISQGQLAFVGTLADFSCAAAKIGCAMPGTPSITKITPHDASAIIEFMPPVDSGTSPITRFNASCASGLDSIGTGSGTSSPITVTGLTNGRQYSCIVTATNQQGTGAASAAVSVRPALPPSYQATTIKLSSDIGDFVGGGRSYQYTQASARITVGANGNRLTIGVDGDEYWTGEFALPASQEKWAPGTYSGLTRYGFHDPAKGGLSWTGEGRGCNTSKGSITITAATYTDDALDSISFTFVQNCEGGATALKGTVTWGANDPTLPPGPVVPVPTNLWKAPSSAVPASGNYAYLQSDAGDYIGQGQTYLYTGTQAPYVMAGSTLTISTGGWGGYFVPMHGVSELQVGYYPGLSRYPFHNPFKGGLDWSGNGRGCNQLSGWFAIDDIAYADGQLQRISMRFTQYCENGSAALRGQVRWTRP
jgi:hypothetical protein